MRALKAVLYASGLPVALLVTWWVASADSTSIYFPSLASILADVYPTWLEGGTRSLLVTQAVPSITRLLLGYLLAVVVGVSVGAVIGANRTARAFAEPSLELFRAIPGPVLVPILSLLAGIGDRMKLLVVFTGCVWPILLNAVEGVRAIDPVMADSARAYRIRGWARWRTVVLPSASPQIVAGMRQALSVGIILMVISEMFAATNGLGFTVVQFQRTFAISQMWTGIGVLGVVGFGLSLLFRLFEWRALGWYHGQRRATHDQ